MNEISRRSFTVFLTNLGRLRHRTIPPHRIHRKKIKNGGYGGYGEVRYDDGRLR